METSSVMKRYTSISGSANTATRKSLEMTRNYINFSATTIVVKSVRIVNKTRVVSRTGLRMAPPLTVAPRICRLPAMDSSRGYELIPSLRAAGKTGLKTQNNLWFMG